MCFDFFARRSKKVENSQETNQDEPNTWTHHKLPTNVDNKDQKSRQSTSNDSPKTRSSSSGSSRKSDYKILSSTPIHDDPSGFLDGERDHSRQDDLGKASSQPVPGDQQHSAPKPISKRDKSSRASQGHKSTDRDPKQATKKEPRSASGHQGQGKVKKNRETSPQTDEIKEEPIEKLVKYHTLEDVIIKLDHVKHQSLKMDLSLIAWSMDQIRCSEQTTSAELEKSISENMRKIKEELANPVIRLQSLDALLSIKKLEDPSSKLLQLINELAEGSKRMERSLNEVIVTQLEHVSCLL